MWAWAETQEEKWRNAAPRPSGREQAEVCAVGIAAGLESRRGPGSTRGQALSPNLAELGRGAQRRGGVPGAGSPGGMRRGQVPGGKDFRAPEGEGRGFRAGRLGAGPPRAHLKSLLAGRHLLQEAEMWKAAVLSGGCAAGLPAGG